MQTPPANLYEFGDFQLDAAKRRLRRLDGTPIPLTPRVFDTLLYMVEHHDSVLDKERIMEAVWPDSIVEENNLAQAISKLRQIFGERKVPFPSQTQAGGSPKSRFKNRCRKLQMKQSRLTWALFRSQRSSAIRCPLKLPGSGRRRRSQRLLFLQLCFSFVIAACLPIRERRVRRPKPYRCLRQFPKRASLFCRSTISAMKNKTRILQLACRMKFYRTWRESPI